MVDQMRFDCLGQMGLHPVRTPNLDGLAAGGLTCTHAYTTIPTCCPARQSFLTGDRAERIGALWNYDITLPVPSLTPDTPTWTQAVKAAGYNTAYIGKWHVSPDYDPTSFGFDHYYGEEDYIRMLRNDGHTNPYVGDWQGGATDLPLDLSRTNVFAREAIQAIDSFNQSDAPWMLHLDFPEPHLPCVPSEPFASMYNPNRISPWMTFSDPLENKPFMQRRQLQNWNVENLSWNEWAPIVASYFAIITQMDAAIGLVLDHLEARGVADQTIVAFTSDHGDMCGSRGMVDKHFNMYDDVVRVPLILRSPGVIPPGSVSDELLSHTLDLPRTILDMLGIPAPVTMTGRSFESWFSTTSGSGNESFEPFPVRDAVVATYHGAQFGLYCQRMIRTRELKLVWNLTDLHELYDLIEDPYELVNQYENPLYRDRRITLGKRLYDLLRQEDDPILRETWLAHQLTGQYEAVTINPTV
jgi:arylsulfatase A-like enzyme